MILFSEICTAVQPPDSVYDEAATSMPADENVQVVKMPLPCGELCLLHVC
jgi:hypothetical protein